MISYLFAIVLLFLKLNLFAGSQYYNDDLSSSLSDEGLNYSFNSASDEDSDELVDIEPDIEYVHRPNLAVDKKNKDGYRKKLLLALNTAREREDIPMMAFIYLKSRYIYSGNSAVCITGSIIAGVCIVAAPVTAGISLIPGAVLGGTGVFTGIKSKKYYKVEKKAEAYLLEFMPMRTVINIGSIKPGHNWKSKLINILINSGVNMQSYTDQTKQDYNLDWI